MVKPWKAISSKVIRTEQFLELFSHTLNFFLRDKDVKISLHIIILIVRGFFDRTHVLNKLFLHIFAWCARFVILYFFMYIINK